jgi:tetratricopeptide (TPR) repeat protein
VSLLDRERDKEVRLMAVEALSTTASFVHAEAIGRLLPESAEPDPAIRQRVWEVLSRLFERASPRELSLWAERFRGDSALDRTRRSIVLGILEKRLEEAKMEEELAIARQNLGETLLQLDRADEAVVKFRTALDYWVTVKKRPDRADFLMQQLMQALLRSKKYTDAAEFATATIQQDQRNIPNMFVKIKDEVARLQDTNDLDGALALIAACQTIPLGTLYAPQLRLMEETVKKRRTSGGAVWVQQNDWLPHGMLEWVPAV